MERVKPVVVWKGLRIGFVIEAYDETFGEGFSDRASAEAALQDDPAISSAIEDAKQVYAVAVKKAQAKRRDAA